MLIARMVGTTTQRAAAAAEEGGGQVGAAVSGWRAEGTTGAGWAQCLRTDRASACVRSANQPGCQNAQKEDGTIIHATDRQPLVGMGSSVDGGVVTRGLSRVADQPSRPLSLILPASRPTNYPQQQCEKELPLVYFARRRRRRRQPIPWRRRRVRATSVRCNYVAEATPSIACCMSPSLFLCNIQQREFQFKGSTNNAVPINPPERGHKYHWSYMRLVPDNN